MINKFWLVWCPNKSLPTTRHDTVSIAIDEAMRLARIENDEFFVMECVGSAVPRGVVYSRYDNE